MPFENHVDYRLVASYCFPIEPIGVPPHEAGVMIHGSRSTVYRLLKAGELQAVKRGAATLVLLNSIRKYQSNLPAVTFGVRSTASPLQDTDRTA